MMQASVDFDLAHKFLLGALLCQAGLHHYFDCKPLRRGRVFQLKASGEASFS